MHVVHHDARVCINQLPVQIVRSLHMHARVCKHGRIPRLRPYLHTEGHAKTLNACFCKHAHYCTLKETNTHHKHARAPFKTRAYRWHPHRRIKANTSSAHDCMHRCTSAIRIFQTRMIEHRACAARQHTHARSAEVKLLGRQHARKGLGLPQAWNAGSVNPPGRSRRSDSRAAAPVLRAHMHTLLSYD